MWKPSFPIKLSRVSRKCRCNFIFGPTKTHINFSSSFWTIEIHQTCWATKTRHPQNEGTLSGWCMIFDFPQCTTKATSIKFANMQIVLNARLSGVSIVHSSLLKWKRTNLICFLFFYLAKFKSKDGDDYAFHFEMMPCILCCGKDARKKQSSWLLFVCLSRTFLNETLEKNGLF